MKTRGKLELLNIVIEALEYGIEEEKLVDFLVALNKTTNKRLHITGDEMYFLLEVIPYKDFDYKSRGERVEVINRKLSVVSGIVGVLVEHGILKIGG